MLALVTDPAGSPVCRILPETPAFHEALHDRALRGTPWLVYLWLYERLPDGNPYGDYRFVKQSAVAAELPTPAIAVAPRRPPSRPGGYINAWRR